jgi:hypothetical protein
MAKYPKKTLVAAGKFLAGYQLDLKALTEQQKTIVLSYFYFRKYLVIVFSSLAFSLAVFIFSSFIWYGRAQQLITKSDQVEINLHTYGQWCFEKGILFGVCSIASLVMLLYIVMIPLQLRAKTKILNAFLPFLKKPAPNDNPAAT